MGYDFTGMKADEIDGIHVRVIGSDTCTEGRLNNEGKVDGHQAFDMGINGRGESVVEGLTDWTIGVEKIWDERYWNSFPVDDVRDADAVVVNGKAYPMLNVVSADDADYSTDNLVVESRREDENGDRKPIGIPAPAISCVLELKEDVVSPANGAGLYKDAGGNLWINSYDFIVKIEPSRIVKNEYRAVLVGRVIDPDAFPFVKVSEDDEDIRIPSKIGKHTDRQ